MVLASPPATAAEPYTLTASLWDLDFVHAGYAAKGATYAEIMGSGACVFDADKDGWEDVFIGNGRYANASTQQANDPRSALYHNLQGQGFERVVGALNISAWTNGCAAGDFDRDGDQDLATTGWGGTQLWRNDGNLTFTNITAQAGIAHPTCETHLGPDLCFGHSLAWLDYDRDADLDLYVLNYVAWNGTGTDAPLLYPGQCNVLWRNDGGNFTDVSAASDADDCGRNHLALAVADVDRDGWQDIFIASDETEDTLLINQHDGTFVDRGAAAGVADRRGGMGAAWGDYDGDGRLDLVITHFEGERFALYHQNADGTFTDRAASDGLAGTSNFVGWGAEFADLDNDGRLDLLLANGHVSLAYTSDTASGSYGQENLVYHNDGGTFRNVTATAWSRTERSVSRGLAVGDLDQDGNLDAVIVNNPDQEAQAFRNGGGANNWLALRLSGNATVNPQAIGAVVAARIEGRTVEREVVGASSYLSLSSRDVRFGLGNAVEVERLDVHWPDGTLQTFGPFMANQLLTLVAGGTPAPLRVGPLAGAVASVVGNRLDPVALTGDVLRAPGGLDAATWTVLGATTQSSSASATFPALGTYQATFRVSDASGRADDAPVEIRIINLMPLGHIANPGTVLRNASVTLDATGASDRDGQIANWTWTIEGGTYYGARPTLRFGSLGQVPVELRVSDNEGGVAFAAATATVVNQLPVARAGRDLVGNLQSTFQLDGSASIDPDGAVVAWHWDFGDGTAADGARPTKRYTATGAFVVRLTVVDADGALGSDDLLVTINEANAPPIAVPGGPRVADRVHAVTFDGAASYDPDGTVVAWAWDFGDGATAAGAQVAHTYAALGTFQATLSVTDDTAGTSSAAARVEVRNLEPTLDPVDALAQEGLGPVAFAGAGADPDGSIVAWRWDFGDGASVDAATATHAYAGYGRFTALLSATDNDGATTSAARPVWVYARPQAQPGSDRSTDRLTDVLFDGTASSDADGTIVAWGWDFGDGSSATTPTASHRYAALGTFAARLTVVDNDGFVGIAAVNVTVLNLPPVARLQGYGLANVNQTLVWSSGGSFDPDGAIVLRSWAFSDNASAAGGVASHAFTQLGAATVRLTLADNDGAVTVATMTVDVVDWLAVAVVMDHDVYLATEQPHGIAQVRFANGLPAGGATVNATVSYLVHQPTRADLPRVRVILHHIDGTTDARGELSFDVPSMAPAPVDAMLPFAQPPTTVEPPVPAAAGTYLVAALGSWKGSAGLDHTTYQVNTVPAWILAGLP